MERLLCVFLAKHTGQKTMLAWPANFQRAPERRGYAWKQRTPVIERTCRNPVTTSQTAPASEPENLENIMTATAEPGNTTQ